MDYAKATLLISLGVPVSLSAQFSKHESQEDTVRSLAKQFHNCIHHLKQHHKTNNLCFILSLLDKEGKVVLSAKVNGFEYLNRTIVRKNAIKHLKECFLAKLNQLWFTPDGIVTHHFNLSVDLLDNYFWYERVIEWID